MLDVTEPPQIDIVFQHEDFLVLNKPAGFSVQELSEIYQKSFNAFHPVHRLDKETSGLWLVALNSNANGHLSRLFANQQIEKHYVAILPAGKKLKKKQGWIKGDMQKARRKAWKLCKSQLNPAVTFFQTNAFTVQTAENSLITSNSQNNLRTLRLAYLQPLTGKTHQLRVAMKANGAAILGDDIYAGEQAKTEQRLYLHAYKLIFQYQSHLYKFECMAKQGEYFLQQSFQQVLSKFEPKALQR